MALSLDERRRVHIEWIVAWLEDTLVLAKALAMNYEDPTANAVALLSVSPSDSESPSAPSTEPGGSHD